MLNISTLYLFRQAKSKVKSKAHNTTYRGIHMKKEKQILKIIASIRLRLKSVSSTDVANHIGCTKQNIYFHLGKGAAAGIEHLQIISNAINAVKAQQEKEKTRQLKTLTKKLVA